MLLRTKGICLSVALAAVSTASCGAGDTVTVEINGEPTDLTITLVDENSIVVSDLELQVGDTARLHATVLNALGLAVAGDTAVDWSSSEPTVATVSEDGTVLALSEGTTQIDATYEGVTAQVPAIVDPASTPANQAPVASITSPAGNVTIIQGEAIDFQGTASDSDGTVASHQWALGDGTTYGVEDPGSYVYTDAGTYSVSYRVTDDDGAVSAADTRTVVVQAETPPPSGSRTVVFHSDWSTATGTSNNAVMDRGKSKSWTEYGGAPNNQLQVVTASSTGLNWPAGMANVLQVNANNVRWGQVGFRVGDNYFEPPRTAGESLYYRMYFSLVIPAGWGGDRFTHGWNDGGEGISNGSFNFSWSVEEVGTGYRFRARTGVGGSDPYVLWDHSPDAQRNRVYRVEYQVTRVDASNMRLHIRIYDESKTLIIDDSSYSSLQTPYGTRLDSNPLIPLNHRDGWDGFKYLRVGTNGYADGLGTGGIHSYFGGVAICTGDWCGPYSNGM